MFRHADETKEVYVTSMVSFRCWNEWGIVDRIRNNFSDMELRIAAYTEVKTSWKLRLGKLRYQRYIFSKSKYKRWKDVIYEEKSSIVGYFDWIFVASFEQSRYPIRIGERGGARTVRFDR